MSIVKGFLLIVLFLYLIYRLIVLNNEYSKQREYFIKTLNHDLKVAILAQIRGLEILQKINKDNNSQKELISDINQSCIYTLDMITMLLNTYKYERGEAVLHYESFNLSDLIMSAYHLILPMAREKNIEIVFDICKNCELEADREGIFRVVSTLLTTAIYYSLKETSISFKVRRIKGKLKVTILYCGKTLTEEECRRMFSNNPRFSTVGHGIRMHLCKKIIDFHKGVIKVENCTKMINSFTFILPTFPKSQMSKVSTISALQLNSF